MNLEGHSESDRGLSYKMETHFMSSLLFGLASLITRPHKVFQVLVTQGPKGVGNDYGRFYKDMCLNTLRR